MIKKGERRIAQQQVLARIGQQIKAFGFPEKPSGQSFIRSIPGGKWAFHVSFIPHTGDFDLTVEFAVRINEIEDLVNQYDSTRDPKYKPRSMTLGVELGNLSQGRPQRWSVSAIEDIPPVCDELVKAFERIGMPFLQAHSDGAAAYRALVSTDPKDLLLSPILGPRYMRAVAATYLFGDATRLSDLCEEYELKLLNAEDDSLEDFRALCQGLRRKR